MNTVILGTAHHKGIPGKCSPDKKFYEYQYSRKVCQEVKKQLENKGYKVIIDALQDDMKMNQSAELQYRCMIVNNLHKKYKNCIYISIHVNAAGADGKWHNATGWEVHTTKGVTKSDNDPDKESNFYVLKHTNCPAVLTENFFQDTKEDVEFLISESGFNQIVKTHVDGIIKYIEDN